MKSEITRVFEILAHIKDPQAVKINPEVNCSSTGSCSDSIHEQQQKFNKTDFIWWHATVHHQTARPHQCSHETKLLMAAMLCLEKRHVCVKWGFNKQFELRTASSSIGKVPAPIIQSRHRAASHSTLAAPLFIEEANPATKHHNQCMPFLPPLAHITFVAFWRGAPAIQTIQNAATLIHEIKAPKLALLNRHVSHSHAGPSNKHLS